jgi:predicted RNase H-like HicB family nuclease
MIGAFDDELMAALRRAGGELDATRLVVPNACVRRQQATYYHQRMLRYHVAFYLPHAPGEMVVAEALDFPGAVTQGFDLQDARLMIASAIEDLAQALLEEGNPLPVPAEDANSPDADLIELVPLSVHAGTAYR